MGSKWTGNLIAPQSVRAISIRSERPRIWDTKCPMPTHVNDVAAFILRERGAMTAMKLQKLVYYSQAWVLVWDERQLFPEMIETWVNGPVCPDLYQPHRGKFRVCPGDIPGHPETLDPDDRETVRAVLQFYGYKSARWLSDLTYSEPPWSEARGGLADGERGGPLVWRFSSVDKGGPFAWSALQDPILYKEVMEKLHQFETT